MGEDRISLLVPQDDFISVHYVPPENAIGKLAVGKYMVINED